MKTEKEQLESLVEKAMMHELKVELLKQEDSTLTQEEIEKFIEDHPITNPFDIPILYSILKLAKDNSKKEQQNASN